MIKLMVSLTLVFSYLSNFSQSTNSITIEFENIDLVKKGWQGRKFYFKINNQVFSPSKSPKNIVVTKTMGYDFAVENIYFSFDSTFANTSPALACFFPDSTYIIKINPCSQYELFPKTKSQRRQGKIRATAINLRSADTIYTDIENLDDTLVLRYETKERSIPRSSMCSFAPLRILYYTRESEKVYEAYVHFLQGEKFIVIYDPLNGLSHKAFVGFIEE